MKKILLPTDFSDNAWSATVYALKLYADEECIFYFLNSTHLTASTPRTHITGHYLQTLKDEATKELSELKNMTEVANKNANHSFEIIVSDKNLKTAIKDTVSKHDIDLIAMGTKGATGAKEIFFGSNTVKIIKEVRDCPILVVPDQFIFCAPKQIAFPTDYNRFYGEKELKVLKDFADLYNSKIRVLHINVEKKLNDIQEYNLNTLNDYLSGYEHTFHWMPVYSKKAVEINEFVEELGIEVLAMVNYKHSLIEGITKEPVIEKIGFRPIVPFLVIPD